MYTPIVSTVGLNGQLEEPPVAGVQSGSWISSFAPAAAIDGFVGLTATVDSFCLFCGKCVAAGLTRCSLAVAADAVDPPTTVARTAVVAAATSRSCRLIPLRLLHSARRPTESSVERTIQLAPQATSIPHLLVFNRPAAVVGRLRPISGPSVSVSHLRQRHPRDDLLLVVARVLPVVVGRHRGRIRVRATEIEPEVVTDEGGRPADAKPLGGVQLRIPGEL